MRHLVKISHDDGSMQTYSVDQLEQINSNFKESVEESLTNLNLKSSYNLCHLFILRHPFTT